MITREFVLRRKSLRLALRPDGAVAWLESLAEKRLLFGREQLELYKVQAGVKVRCQKPEWKLEVSPYSATFSGRPFDSIEWVQKVQFSELGSQGYTRRVRLANTGSASMHLLLVSFCDPTAAHIRSESTPWGALSLNGFNRTNHVAMDEVADPTSGRVIGAFPAPRCVFMTRSLARAEDVAQAAELPESTAGMSGQLLTLMLHDVELPPQASAEIKFVSLYSASGLEEALLDFRKSMESEEPKLHSTLAACSSADLSLALGWVKPTLEGIEYEEESLERVECLPALTFADHEGAQRIVASTALGAGRDGFLPRSETFGRPDALASSVFLANASTAALLCSDKKQKKAIYKALRRLAISLSDPKIGLGAASKREYPEGWRRRLGKGFPTGQIPELALAAAAGLESMAGLAAHLSKPEDSARFRESAGLTLEAIRPLMDESGSLPLCVDKSGAVHREATIDQAVALYRNTFDKRAASAAVHRLQDRDFDTSYGPRTVPTTNQVYFNGSYGEGQLGGCWPRASLAAAIVSYRSGYPGLGSLLLQKTGGLVADGVVRLGRVPGNFPTWIDVDAETAHGEGSDPVAASRLLEALVSGELGLSVDSEGPRLSPAVQSTLRWLVMEELWLGEPVSVFVGRNESRAFTFARGSKIRVEGGTRFGGFDPAASSEPGIIACTFFEPGQVVCVGSNAARSTRAVVRFRPRAAALMHHLSVGVDELEPSSGAWSRVQTARVAQTMALEVSLQPGGWKALRLSTG
jgi:hypothetical protein